MLHGTLRAIAPYVVGLAVAAALYAYAGQIEYTPRPGQLGPAAWPRIAIALMGAACLFELVRRLAGGRTEAHGISDLLEDADEPESEATFPWLLVAGVVLLGAYGLALPTLGFIVSTFIFLAAFMYVGRYRRHGAIWATSFLVTLFCGVLFLRIAYVSLPRGIPPFDRVADVFLMLPGL
jgi:hypothetical protein